MTMSGQFANTSNFTRILKSLQIENANIPQLKLLKQQHAYLEKLRQQRSKIQQLKAKYDQTQNKMTILTAENRKFKNIIDDQERTIEQLQSQLQQERNQKLNLQKVISKQIQTQKDRNKIKISQLHQQIEQLKKTIKQKDLMLFTMQEDCQHSVQSLKQSFAIEKKKLISQYQNRIRQQLLDKNDSEIIQLRGLVARQNKALKLQSQQIQDLNQNYSQVCEQNEQLQQQCQKISSQNNVYEQKLSQIVQECNQLRIKLQGYQQDNFTRTQLQDIRKKMSELTKGQIQRIQFIVNQFQ